jgi:hypothetical protein
MILHLWLMLRSGGSQVSCKRFVSILYFKTGSEVKLSLEIVLVLVLVVVLEHPAFAPRKEANSLAVVLGGWFA